MRSELACHCATFFTPCQTIGSEENQGLADFGVIKYYGWKKVTIFQMDVASDEIVRLLFMEVFMHSYHWNLSFSYRSQFINPPVMYSHKRGTLYSDHLWSGSQNSNFDRFTVLYKMTATQLLLHISYIYKNIQVGEHSVLASFCLSAVTVLDGNNLNHLAFTSSPLAFFYYWPSHTHTCTYKIIYIYILFWNVEIVSVVI